MENLPTGTMFAAEPLKAVCEAVVAENLERKHAGRPPVIVMYDQIYWVLTYGAAKHVTPVSLVPEMAPYTVFVDGISKAFAATGLRVGWGVGPPSIIHSARYCPAPPAVAMPAELNPASTHRPGSSGVSPISQLLSGVKLSGPLTKRSKPHSASAGIRNRPAASGSANFSQSGSRSWNEKPSGMRPTRQGLVYF